MPVRLKDIAAELGVSVMTVSKVLRNEGRIGERTRRRVLECAKRMGYQPDLNARTLVSGRSALVGLVVPDLLHPFFAALAKHLAVSLRTHGFGVAIASSEESPAIEIQEIATFLSRRVDALILVSSLGASHIATLRQIEAQGVPYVLLDRLIPKLKAHFVGSDDRAIGALATEHLVSRGYRRIAHIQRTGISTGENRKRGYLETLERHGLRRCARWLASAESADEQGERCGYEAMQRLLQGRERPDAVFSYNDVISYGALKAILEAGLKVPGDIALIGVSNLASLSFWDASPVSLTTIDQQIPTVADHTVNLLLKLIEKGSLAKPERILVPARLVLRNST